MKKTLLVLALAASMATGGAASTYTINSDNSLYLGFFAADEVSTKSVLVNLGTSADVSSGLTLDLSSALSSVDALKSNWFNNSQVYWSLIGHDGAYGEFGNFYVGRPTIQPLLKTDVMGSTSLNEDQYWALSDNVAAILGAHTSGNATLSTVIGSTGNSHEISIVDNSPVTFSGMADANFQTFTSAVYEQVTGGLSIQQFSYNGTSFPTTFDGTYGTISQLNGVITVVPEPSTYALLGFGVLLLVTAYRRRAS